MNIKTVYIEITNRCNLNCRTCYNRSGLNRETKELTVEQIEDIMSTLARYGAKRFLLSGGEPSLHSDFHRVLVLIDKYPDYSFGIVTNGTNHDPLLIDYLCTRKNISLQISLDGATDEQNSLTRGAGSFAKAISFAEKVQNPHMTPLLKMVVSQANESGVEAFYQLALSLGCIPEYAAIYKSGNAVDRWNDKALTPQGKLKLLKTVQRLNRELGAEAFLPMCTFTCPFSTGEGKNMSVCVKVDGSIQPCQSLYDDEFTLGNALRFDKAEFTEKLDRILATAKARKHADLDCGKCMLKDFCGRGCMAAAYLNSGDPLGSDEDCTFRKLTVLNGISIDEVVK